ncbi:MAG: PAS domain S-box protein [Deltaproteobacteria bacterium]|nr:PAS domain S-box protein [Deltaproteobacteria bacterium]
MNELLTQDTSTSKRLRILILSRLTIATLILAVAGYFKLNEADFVSEISQTSIFVIIFLTYFLSLSYILFAKYVKNLMINIYLQSTGDVLTVTGLVYFTGGIESVYPVFYQLIIIYTTIFLERRGGMLIASACAILYGILINLQYYKIVYPVGDKIYYDANYTASHIFFRTLIYILSFYVIAFLASFVVEKEKKARVLLEEKENAFDQLDLLHRSIIQSIDAGILTVSLQKEIKSFNRAAEDITGFPAMEILNRDIEDIFPGYSKIVETVNGRTESETKSFPRRFELEITGKEGKNITLGCSISPLNDHQGKIIGDILIFQDLSNIKMMEEALEKNRRLAYIGEMAASLAHELRNPMASISGSIQLLKRDLLLNDADERLMQIVLRGKDQLENIIKDFLFMARPVSGARTECDVVPVIEEVIEAVCYLPEWDEKIIIEKDLSDQAVLYANKTEIRQILWNLVVNAVQAIPDGGTISISARAVDSTGVDDHLEIKVADTGGGIAEEIRPQIFEPFYTTKERGTGLGLAIVNRIVEGYGGRIGIDTEYGRGAMFVVSLPIHNQRK